MCSLNSFSYLWLLLFKFIPNFDSVFLSEFSNNPTILKYSVHENSRYPHTIGNLGDDLIKKLSLVQFEAINFKFSPLKEFKYSHWFTVLENGTIFIVDQAKPEDKIDREDQTLCPNQQQECEINFQFVASAINCSGSLNILNLCQKKFPKVVNVC